MKRDEALRILADHREELAGFSVKSLSLFGSLARDEATESSDVDILVEFEEHARVGLFKFIELQQFLESILGCPVDLGTPDALRERIRDRVMSEAIRVA